jgi:SAM-dependent methyltransferase
MPSSQPATALSSLRRRAYELVAPRLRGDGPLIPPARLHAVGDSDFRVTGDEFLRLFVELAALRPDERVLDVGCGVGRIARALTGHLGERGSYDGFDVARVAIRWCRRHYARHSNFTFTHVNVANSSYNPAGAVPAARFSFPYPSSSFDFVFLTSVFTHMMGAAVERYLHEIARVLAPGGRCLLTFFLLDDEARRLIGEGRSTQPFQLSQLSHAIVDAEHPEAAVAFDEDWVLSRLAEAPLRVRMPLRHGSWCGRDEFTSYQDIVIAEAPPDRR